MNYLNKYLLGISLISLSFLAQAQEESSTPISNPPISMEAFVGNRNFSYQMIINKKLQSLPKFGFFGVTHLQPEWGEPKIDDYMVQGNLTYSVIKGIDLSSGFIMNPIDGIRPSAGIIFSIANPKLLAVLNPRVDLSKNANFETIGLIEFKPKLNEKLRLYTRLQGVYTHNIGLDHHSRSYIMLRAGVSFKEFTFGAATNFDWYGPMRMNKNNYGGFLLVNLF